MRTPWLLRFLLLVVLAPGRLQGQEQDQGKGAEAVPQISGTIEKVASEVATRCHIPMLLEIAEPTEQMRIEFSSCDPKGLFNKIVHENPGYSFEFHGRAVHLFDRRLEAQKQNFLNWRFKEFVLPKNVAEFKNVLMAKLGAKRSGAGERGGLIHGIYPLDLSSRVLPPKKYVNATAREILLSVVDLDGSFVTIVVFPKRSGLTDRDLDAAFLGWQWRSVAVEAPKPDSN